MTKQHTSGTNKHLRTLLLRSTTPRRYCALVKGRRHGRGTITLPLSGQACVTHFDALGEPVPSPAHTWLTRVALWPHTGRTHQLRRHMAMTGTAILGDPRYRHSGQQGGQEEGEEGQGQGTDRLQGNVTQVDELGKEAPVEHGEGGKDHGCIGSGREEGEQQQQQEQEQEQAWWQEVEARDAGEGNGTAGGEGSTGDGGLGRAGEVLRRVAPAPDAEWVLRVVQEAASEECGMGVGSRAGDVLSGGERVSLCLWAVGLRFRHPVSGERLEVDVSSWADVWYGRVLAGEKEAAAGVVG